MKYLIIFMLLTANVAWCGEIGFGLGTTHVFSSTWKDKDKVRHPYNEDNNLISYTRDDGLGAAIFYNSYGDDSLALFRDVEIYNKNVGPIYFSSNITLGLVTGYQKGGGAGINVLASPYGSVGYKNHTLNVGAFGLWALILFYGYDF